MKFRWRSFVFGVLGLAAVSAAYYVLGTSDGSWRLTRKILSWKLRGQPFAVRHVTGSLLEGLNLHQVSASDFPRTPRGTGLKIRLLSVAFPIRDFPKPFVTVRDARLDLPDSEHVLISGTTLDGDLRFNFYSRMLDTREVLSCFIDEKDAHKFSGPVGPLDLDVTGSPKKFEVRGVFYIRQLNYYTFSLTDAAGTLSLTVQPRSVRDGLTGEIRIERGTLNLKNCSVKMAPSRILYAGDLKRPVFDLLGTSVIEKIPVRAVFKGTFRRPELRLSSDPPLSQEQLLLMLATGKRWKAIEGTSGREGELPVDLVTDFLDFIALGGSGSRLAQQLGVEGSLLVRDEGRTTGLGVRKSLTDKVGVRYGVEQTQAETGEAAPVVRQKLGAELDVTPTDQISLEAESEVVPTEKEVPASGKEPERSGKVLLKYKRKF